MRDIFYVYTYMYTAGKKNGQIFMIALKHQKNYHLSFKI
jgi:hypothetical protein